MSIQGSDPLALLAYQSALIGTPLQEGAAEGSTQLDSLQRAAIIGEVIPIVFCRRVGDIGGVLISPPATEARFTDAANGDVTASYHLVLSEGRIDSIQVRDVFQRSCRVGSFTQTYNRRAGTFVPGNFIDDSPNLEAPYYCGTGGTYAGLSTMAFSITIPAGFDYWNRQVHAFARGGMWVSRLLDSVTGPSNNVVDLLLYLLQTSSRVATEQIDNASLVSAARFTDANGFWFNGIEASSKNVRDWMAEVLPYFLLRESRVNGKEGLRPLLPSNANGTINTGPISWSFTFTEKHVQPDGFSIRYTSLSDRKPFCVLVLWRQQPTDDIGLIRTTEIRYSNTAADGPFEQHDLSRYCVSEDHAVKVGAFILSRRHHVTHTLTLNVRPDSFNPTLAPGDLVRVKLDRVASTGAASVHDFLYEVDRIGKSITGEVLLDLTHFPVDEQLRSVVALEVIAAQGSGIILPTGKTGVSCDINSSTDTSIPAETGFDNPPAFTQGMEAPLTLTSEAGQYGGGAIPMISGSINSIGGGGSLGGIGGGGSIGGGGGDGYLGNQESDTPSDELSDPVPSPDIGMPHATPRVGNELSAPTVCEGGVVKWYRTAPGGKTYAGSGSSYTIVEDDVDKTVNAEIECPDPSSPTGYGPPIPTKSTPTIRPAAALPDATVLGSYSPTGATYVEIPAGVHWAGAGPQFIGGSDCIPKSNSGGSGSGVFTGVQAVRLVNGSSNICGGYASITLEIQNAAGVWTSFASVVGGNAGWKNFVGTLIMNSSEPDARPVSESNFGP